MTTKGYFGQFGGSFVPEPIQALLDELEVTFDKYKDDPEFLAEFRHYLKDYSGRETPLYFAGSLTDHLGGAKIYLKHEDLNHLGSHKLNNVLGQILLAKRMGKKRVIAETGAGQHGVATAAAAPSLVWLVMSTWGQKMWSVNVSIFSAWRRWEQLFTRLKRGHELSRMRSMQPLEHG